MGQQKKLTWFVPVTPAGSPLPHLAATKEQVAWEKLVQDAPYKDKSALVHRGYTMDKYPFDPR
jgi:hypothetical protein